MTKWFNQLIPFIVIGVVVGSFIIEAKYDIEIDLEAAALILAPMGVGGAAIAIVKKAHAVKTALPQDLKNVIEHEVNEWVRKHPEKLQS